METPLAGCGEAETVSACRIQILEDCQARLMEHGQEEGVEQGVREAPYNPKLVGDEGSLEEPAWNERDWLASEPAQNCW